MIGGLFSHDKVSAGASGKYKDGSELPPLPGQSPVYQQGSQAPQWNMQGPQGAPLDVSGLANNQFSQVSQLPKAPPVRKPSLFDDDHRRETFLAIAAGMGQGQNFGEGLGAAAQNLLGLQRGLREEGRPQIGGPYDAFEISWDPEKRENVFKPIQAVRDYRAEQAAFEADLRNKRPPASAKDNMDALGRLTAGVSSLPPEQRQQAWESGRQYLASLGIEGIPETYNPSYREYGGPVPVMARADTGQFNADEKKRHNLVEEGFTGAKVQQGATRVGLAVDAAKNRGPQRGGARVTTEAQYRALRPGTPYTAPDGSLRIKK